MENHMDGVPTSSADIFGRMEQRGDSSDNRQPALAINLGK